MPIIRTVIAVVARVRQALGLPAADRGGARLDAIFCVGRCSRWLCSQRGLRRILFEFALLQGQRSVAQTLD